MSDCQDTARPPLVPPAWRRRQAGRACTVSRVGRKQPEVTLEQLDAHLAELAAADDQRFGRARLDRREARLYQAAAARRAKGSEDAA